MENTKPKILSKEWFSDTKNLVTTVIASGLIVGLFYLFATYVLPWLVTVTWNLVNLVLGIACLGVLLIIFTSKRFWRSIKYLSEFIGKYTLGFVIDLDPFNILQMKIEKAIKDREKVKKQGDIVSAKRMELQAKIDEKQTMLKEAKSRTQLSEKAIKVAKNKGDNDEVELLLADYELDAAKVTGCVDYINTLTPIAQDLGFLEEYSKKIFRLTGIKIEKSKTELDLGKDKYEAVMSGTGVARASWKALMGDDTLNQDAELALRTIQQRVNQSLAEMKNSMELTSDIIRSLEKDNTVRARRGIDIIKEMDAQNQSEYKAIEQSNWGDDLKFTPTSGYAELLLEETITKQLNK